MNTSEIKAAVPSLSEVRGKNVYALKEQASLLHVGSSVIADTYSRASANDAVAAKVLSFSIGQRFENDLAKTSSEPLSKTQKVKLVDDSSVFNIEKVVTNVLNFVNSALTDLARSGANEESIRYFKDQAIQGVSVGVDQAKSELKNVGGSNLIKSIDDSRDQIFKGIEKLPSQPMDYLGTESNSDAPSQTEFNVSTKAGKSVDINFGAKAFVNEPDQASQKQVFTTQASNLSFSLSSELSNNEAHAMANIINQVDDLANTFYRKNIEGLYNKAISLGYDDSAILNRSKSNAIDRKSGTTAYQDVKHLSEAANIEDLASVKAVSNYVTRLMGVMEGAERELSSQQDYNDVINGLVNEMKDVQVPDLLHAINKFHAFNAKFVAVK